MRLEILTVGSRDLDRSRAFYTGKLGFPVVEDRDGSSFVVDAGGIKLHVDKDGTRSPLMSAEPRLVFRTTAIAEHCTKLRDLGISVDGPRPDQGGFYAELKDPDGHPIILLER